MRQAIPATHDKHPGASACAALRRKRALGASRPEPPPASRPFGCRSPCPALSRIYPWRGSAGARGGVCPQRDRVRGDRTRLASRPNVAAATNFYRSWIASCLMDFDQRGTGLPPVASLSVKLAISIFGRTEDENGRANDRHGIFVRG